MFIIKYRKIFYALSLVLVASSVAAVLVFGFRFGIDFNGGSVLELSYSSRPAISEVRLGLDNAGFSGYMLQPAGENSYVLRTKELDQAGKQSAIKAMTKDGALAATEERFSSIGPTIGNELKQKAYVAIALVIAGIVLYITFAFRKVSHPVASWKYGVATIIALAHDVIVPTGAFIIFGLFRSAEIDILFVTALLAILGYSVHDTIVVFDRVRENLKLHDYRKEGFASIVGRSVKQTFGRSINTSLTIFFALVALFFFGGETTKNFSFVLLVGIIAGTYSSIFLATPLLVTMEKLQSKR